MLDSKYSTGTYILVHTYVMPKVQKNVLELIMGDQRMGLWQAGIWFILKVRQKRKKKREEPIRKRKRLKERSKNRQHDSNKKGISFAYYMNAMGPNWFGGPRTRRILLELQKSMAE